jgi:DNA-binding NtrC family response regulator
VGVKVRDIKAVLVDYDGQENYISEIFTECGCDVTTARNGDKILELFKRRSYDLFITDMYGMNGIELLSAIKTYDSEMDVVILSGEMRFCFESLAQAIVEYLNGSGTGNGRRLTEAISRVFAGHGDGLGDSVRYGVAIRPIKRETLNEGRV